MPARALAQLCASVAPSPQSGVVQCARGSSRLSAVQISGAHFLCSCRPSLRARAFFPSCHRLRACAAMRAHRMVCACGALPCAAIARRVLPRVVFARQTRSFAAPGRHSFPPRVLSRFLLVLLELGTSCFVLLLTCSPNCCCCCAAQSGYDSFVLASAALQSFLSCFFSYSGAVVAAPRPFLHRVGCCLHGSGLIAVCSTARQHAQDPSGIGLICHQTASISLLRPVLLTTGR